jgi:hypothetical protein
MNLPASAIEFVDAFNGAFDPAVWKGRLPLVHLYTFKTLVQSEAGDTHFRPCTHLRLCRSWKQVRFAGNRTLHMWKEEGNLVCVRCKQVQGTSLKRHTGKDM